MSALGIRLLPPPSVRAAVARRSLSCWAGSRVAGVAKTVVASPGPTRVVTVPALWNTVPPSHTSLLLHRSFASKPKKRMSSVKLTPEERDVHVKPLLEGGWKMVDGRDAVEKKFSFKDFNQAWSWMNRVAMAGEKMDHHPEWFNVYNRVEVTWSTHDAGGLSLKDIKMAKFCDDTSKIY